MKITCVKASQPENRKIRVAAYCRVSTRRAEQEDSLEMQQEVYRNRIALRSDWELVGIYADAISGLRAEKRPEFLRMMADCKAGKIDLILCKSISRFSRNVVECQHFTEELLSRNIVVEFEKERIRTDDPTSGLMFSLMCSIAQDESRSISENVRLSYQSRFRRGEYSLGSNRILGYDWVDGKLVPNGDAWVVEKVYNLFLEGRTYQEIARCVGAMGAVGLRDGAALSPSTICYILRNETYVGDKLLQKQAPRDFITGRPRKGVAFESHYLRNDHEPIIDRERWDAVQEMLIQRENLKKQGVDVRGRNSHFLFGKVVCGACGALYTRRTYREYAKENSEPPVTYKAWVCKERHKGKNGNGCRNDILREVELLREISAQLGWTSFDEKRFEQTVDNIVIEKSGITIRLKV